MTLVLARMIDEQIDITLEDGRLIVVTVLRIRGDLVRLGFDADRGIRIDRHEITERIAAGIPVDPRPAVAPLPDVACVPVALAMAKPGGYATPERRRCAKPEARPTEDSP